MYFLREKIGLQVYVSLIFQSPSILDPFVSDTSNVVMKCRQQVKLMFHQGRTRKVMYEILRVKLH
jgi:hypothetical protein